MDYSGLGNVPGFYNGNSNNFTRTLGNKVGVKSQMDAFNPNPGGAAAGGAPGYNSALPTTSLYRQIIQTLTAIKGYLSESVNKSIKNK